MKSNFLIIGLMFVFLSFLYFNKDFIFTSRSKGDLHMHTTCSDSKNSYEEMVESAIKRLNFIAITDHIICPEVLNKCKNEQKIVCIPGQEVTGNRTHLLALNINKYINPDFTLSKQVEEIHRLGGIAIAAHPNAEEFYYTDSELRDSGFDAMECTGDSSERRPLPCVFDSDAHNFSSIGWQFNSCLGKIDNFEDLKKAILDRKCERGINLPLRQLVTSNHS